MKRTFCAACLVWLYLFFAFNLPSPAAGSPVTAERTPVRGQMTCQQLDDKQYTITLSLGEKVERVELLAFKNLHVMNSEGLKYGFEATPFICSPNPDGSVAFEALMKSEKEGEMQWKGIATENLVRGTISWIKTGEESVNYIFEGPVKI